MYEMKTEMQMQESQPWGKTIYEIVEGSHISFETKRAKIDLITNPYFGRMLFIDGVLQSSEADEAIYHESLVSSVAECNEKNIHVLIAGGAEGALAREVLKFEFVSKVDMVDWDEELVDHMRREETFSQGAFADPRLQVYYDNIEDYLGFVLLDDDKYNFVIIDLLDPVTEVDLEWLYEVCRKAYSVLKSGGEIIINLGGDFHNVGKFMERFESHGENGEYRKIFVPSFQEVWYLAKFNKK